jgi:hypothetical protein
MDKFEQYIRENRLRLDTGELEKEEWDKIAGTFRKYNSRKRQRHFFAAAIIITFAGLGTLLYLTHPGQTNNMKRTAILDGVENYYKEAETSSIKLIDGEEEAIRKQSIPVEYKDMFTDFLKQLQLIDKQYDIYKTQISEHGYSQELIQQVIYNYQMKLSVLQMLQSEIIKINSRTKNKENENRKIQLHI